MSNDADKVIARAGEKVRQFVDDLLGNDDLSSAFSVAASELYKEQHALKQNPYGEPWEPRPGDDKRQSSPYYGKVIDKSREGFTLRVARPNAGRSCVPFEPRGLGRWEKRFNEIFKERLLRLSWKGA